MRHSVLLNQKSFLVSLLNWLLRVAAWLSGKTFEAKKDNCISLYMIYNIHILFTSYHITHHQNRQVAIARTAGQPAAKPISVEPSCGALPCELEATAALPRSLSSRLDADAIQAIQVLFQKVQCPVSSTLPVFTVFTLFTVSKS